MVTPIFYPGQQVICINSEFTILLAQDPRIRVPVQDQQYTVRRNYQFPHAVGITLQELDNSHALPKGGKLEPNFTQERFALVHPAAVNSLADVTELEAN